MAEVVAETAGFGADRVGQMLGGRLDGGDRGLSVAGHPGDARIYLLGYWEVKRSHVRTILR